MAQYNWNFDDDYRNSPNYEIPRPPVRHSRAPWIGIGILAAVTILLLGGFFYLNSSSGTQLQMAESAVVPTAGAAESAGQADGFGGAGKPDEPKPGEAASAVGTTETPTLKPAEIEMPTETPKVVLTPEPGKAATAGTTGGTGSSQGQPIQNAGGTGGSPAAPTATPTPAATSIPTATPVPTALPAQAPPESSRIYPEAIDTSSYLEPYTDNGNYYQYYGWQVDDDDIRTVWSEDNGTNTSGVGEYLDFYVPAGMVLTKIVIYPGHLGSEDLFYWNSMVTALTISTGGRSCSVDFSWAADDYYACCEGIVINLDEPLVTDDTVRATILSDRAGSRWQDTSISELHLYGYARG